jgi:NAD(P)-dependent dehydrogenase (short-subunit alcohol dehydrogenase family)
MAPQPGVALVTGAGSGIGRATAHALLADGWTVALAGRRREALEETASLAGEHAARATPIAADVTDPDAVAKLFATIAERHGRLDLVFNNAGTAARATNFGDLTWELWRHVLCVNLDGAFLVAAAAYRAMRDQTPQGGRIINNGSISAHVPRWGSAPYTASKHAITGLTRSISLDGRAHNIACSQIDIGNAASSMTARMAAGVPQADGHLAPEPTMDVALVGRTVAQMAALPLEANVQFITIMATAMPFIGRG